MLSILIPIYNFQIVDLVTSLHQQCTACDIEFEIICFDDGSTEKYKQENRQIKNLSKVIYKNLPYNLGRAKIRNHLGKAAQFRYLLFMDCDSKVVSADYIKNYLLSIQEDALIYGGRIYGQNPPKNTKQQLHYFYGKNREEILTEERKLLPYYSFMTNNFLIPKDLFLNIQFEESITNYGHEDTLFGIELQKKAIKIIHINNPLEHLGLEEQAIFLKKQQEAIKNLYQLSKKEALLETKLLESFVWCNKWKLKQLVLAILTLIKPITNHQLSAQNPNLFFLDLFKLQYLLEIDKNGIKHLSS